MKKYLFGILLSIVLLQVAKAENFDSWSLSCKTSPCIISQMLLVKKEETTGVVGGLTLTLLPKNQVLLTVRMSDKANTKQGLGIKIDKNKDIRVNIGECTKTACETNIMVDKQLLAEMNTGSILGVFFFNKDTGKQISLPFSLKGFNNAFIALQNKS
jgi:invasion protein IalB